MARLGRHTPSIHPGECADPSVAPEQCLGPQTSTKHADPDQPNALSLASVGGCNLDACVCFLGSTWRGDHGLSYELLWAFWRQFEHILFIKTNRPNTPILAASEGKVHIQEHDDI